MVVSLADIPRHSQSRSWRDTFSMLVLTTLSLAQLESFELPMEIPALSNPTKPFNTIFIRAPAIHSLNPPPSPSSIPSPESSIEVLATLPEEYQPAPPPSDSPLGEPNSEDLGKVMVRKGRKLVTSFHPELSGDNRIHEYWIEKCLIRR